MTKEQFNALDDLDQAQATWKGVRLKTVIIGSHKYILYDINGLYIEVKYNCKSNTIECFRPVDEECHMMSYYYDHDISELTMFL